MSIIVPVKRTDVFANFEEITDTGKDFGKILSNLHYTHFYLMDQYKKILAEYDLSSPQSNVLGIIDHFSPKPVALEEIKAMVLEPNADVSRIVTRLAEKNFVEKVTNPENRRKVSIKITQKGAKVLQQMLQDKKFQKFTSMLSQKEAETFTTVLQKIRER